MVSADNQDPHGDIPGLMQPWFNAEHKALFDHPPVRMEGGLLMACPLWGKEYISRFAFYCIPTLLAPANKAALAKRSRLVLYIPAEARPMVSRVTAGLKNAGVELILREIPPEVMGMLYRGDYGARFRALALVDNIGTHMAGLYGMGFHMLQPDQAYAHRYFENLMRLGEDHHAIAQMGINVALDAAADEIENYRATGGALVCPNDPELGNLRALVFPDRELGDLGFRHMHPQCQLHSMNAAKLPDKIPSSHRLWWQGRDAVHMYSAHMHPAWLSPELCLNAPVAFTSTLDTLLPEYIPPNEKGEIEFYTPTVDDGLVYVELSDSGKPANRPYVSMEQFCGDFWRNSSFGDAYMPYFTRPALIPIKPQASYLTDAEIERQFGVILAAVEESQDRVGIDWLKQRFSSRFQKAALHSQVLGANG
jgi:hypothetical protein